MRFIIVSILFLPCFQAQCSTDTVPLFPRHRMSIGTAGGFVHMVSYAQPWANIPKTTDFVYVIEPRIAFRAFDDLYIYGSFLFGSFKHNGQKTAPDRKGIGLGVRFYHKNMSDKLRFLCKKKPYRFRFFYQGFAYLQNVSYKPDENIYGYRFYERVDKPEISIGAGLSIRLWRDANISFIVNPTYWPATGQFFWKSKGVTIEYFFK